MMKNAPVFLAAGLLLIMGCGNGDVVPGPEKVRKPVRRGISASKDAVDRAVADLFQNRNKDGS